MKSRLASLIVCGLLATAGYRAQAEELPPPHDVTAPAVIVSEPITHDNLTIFLLYGKSTLPPDHKVLTLQEALEQKKLVVHETSNVNELSVENVSDDAEVFIQSCDIVKGGKQDRVMAVDMLLPPRSGKQPIPSFCCEQGRWQQRGAESATNFASSASNTGNNSLKVVVVNMRGDQGKVWEEVAKAQRQLSDKVGKPVTMNASPSSYQLAIESKDVQEKIEAYVKAFDRAIDGKKDVIGMAIVVNGKIRSVDLYASNALAVKLWGKLLKGAAIDALSELEKDKKFTPATAKDVEQFLAKAETGAWSELKAPAPQHANSPVRQQAEPAPSVASQGKDDPKPRLRVMHRDSDSILLLEAQDTAAKNGMLHRSYLAK